MWTFEQKFKNEFNIIKLQNYFYSIILYYILYYIILHYIIFQTTQSIIFKNLTFLLRLHNYISTIKIKY